MLFFKFFMFNLLVNNFSTNFYFNLKYELWGKAALLKEANAISVELNKKVIIRSVWFKFFCPKK